MLAGLEEAPRSGRLRVLGRDPATIPTGQILYLGPCAPLLKGTLRRALTLGTGQKLSDEELLAVLRAPRLQGLLERLGGLDGQVFEGARNLTSSDLTSLFLARGLIARPSLALVDADELGFDADAIGLLLTRFAETRCAALIVTGEKGMSGEFGSTLKLQMQTDGVDRSRRVAA
jgi:ABC-type transport system involved in cytochrome bd biosynthesis fused ATPase/permease subunit